MDSFGDPKWSHLGTENELIWGPKTDSCWDRFGNPELIDFATEMIFGAETNSFRDDQTRNEMKCL